MPPVAIHQIQRLGCGIFTTSDSRNRTAEPALARSRVRSSSVVAVGAHGASTRAACVECDTL
eukprot:1125932-Prymnesium_polylepis.2